MSRVVISLACMVLSSCTLFRRPPCPAHVPPEEAARFSFPVDVPEEGMQILHGPVVRAVQLAMDDFIPWDAVPPKDATPREACLYRRDAYDVITAPGPEGVMLVRISLNPDACTMGGPPILDAGAFYAVDVRGWRIVAVQR